MADHLRKQIRSAVVAALTGLATTGARVYDEPVDPLSDADIGAGALAVYAGGEEIPEASFGLDRRMQRNLDLVVEVYVKRVTGYADQRDLIVKEVEVAIAANQSAGGVKWIQLRSISTEPSEELDRPALAATLRFEAPYYTTLGTPDVAH